jgi:hypothetical protein
MINQLHPNKRAKPHRCRILKELVPVCRDIILAQLRGEIGAEPCRLEGDGVNEEDYWEVGGEEEEVGEVAFAGGEGGHAAGHGPLAWGGLEIGDWRLEIVVLAPELG